ncbi:electron transfer flavoprotein [Sporolactobacillus sp. KGMB 08714]|uniref:electron transfer flavoprotein n=1 Tax=Sporolactobacillus sp. KGMB 08714 TaxID=3064704 RepID=UPI002FBE8821
MNIITCFKVVPDEQDLFIDVNGDISAEKAKINISNYDLNCIEAGTQLIESNGGNYAAISVGSARINDSKLKKNVLSRGPKSLLLIADDQLNNLDTHQTALALKAGIGKIGKYDLILCGEGSADLYAQQVGVQLGELLNVPTINSVDKISVVNGAVIAERSLEKEVETVELSLPAVISVTSDINQPRIPSMKQILNAGKKPSTVLTASDLDLTDFTRTIEVLSTKVLKQAARKKDIVEGDSTEAIRQFIDKISGELK